MTHTLVYAERGATPAIKGLRTGYVGKVTVRNVIARAMPVQVVPVWSVADMYVSKCPSLNPASRRPYHAAKQRPCSVSRRKCTAISARRAASQRAVAASSHARSTRRSR